VIDDGRGRRTRLWLAVFLVACGSCGTVAAAATASRRTATAARKFIDLSGSYQYFSHVQAGGTLSGVLTISQSGHKISGGLTLGKGSASINGKITGVGNGFVDVAFKAFGANGYVVDDTGTATCNGSEMSGGWSDNGGEGGSWNALRLNGVHASLAAAGCLLPPSVAVTAHATRDGKAVDVEVIARTPRGGGTAHVALRDVRGPVAFTKLTRSGNKLVGTAHLSGRSSCIQTLTASVHQGGATFEKDASVQGGLPVLTGSVRRNNVGEALLKLDVKDARAASACGKPKLDATLVGTAHRVVPLTVKRIPGKPRAFVGTARLPANRSCFTSTSFLSRQVDIENTLPGILMSGPPPTFCMLGPPS
jgi:hypothetical protein